jgi:hypothetical protein
MVNVSPYRGTERAVAAAYKEPKATGFDSDQRHRRQMAELICAVLFLIVTRDAVYRRSVMSYDPAL